MHLKKISRELRWQLLGRYRQYGHGLSAISRELIIIGCSYDGERFSGTFLMASRSGLEVVNYQKKTLQCN